MKMTILKYAIVFCITVVTGAALMVVSHKVHRAEVQISRLDRAVVHEHELIRNLNAEWAYLNDPARLEALAKQYLDLVAPVPADMLGSFAQLPEEMPSQSVVLQGDALADAGLQVTKVAYAPQRGGRE